MSTANIPTSGLTRKQRRNAREVLNLQNSSSAIIPTAPFNRLVNEILQDYDPETAYCVSAKAREALQVASESFLHDVMKGAATYCQHANRDTLQCNDVQAYMRMKEQSNCI